MTNDIDLRDRTKRLPREAVRESKGPGVHLETSGDLLWRKQVDYKVMLPVVRAVEFVVKNRVTQPLDHLRGTLAWAQQREDQHDH